VSDHHYPSRETTRCRFAWLGVCMRESSVAILAWPLRLLSVPSDEATSEPSRRPRNGSQSRRGEAGQADLQAAREGSAARDHRAAHPLGHLDTRAPNDEFGAHRQRRIDLAFPATGALVKGASADSAESWCTGTSVDVAPHRQPLRRGRSRPAKYRISRRWIRSVSISPQRADSFDLAVIRLAAGITPIPQHDSGAERHLGTIVISAAAGVRPDYGLKSGRVIVAACDRRRQACCAGTSTPRRRAGEIQYVQRGLGGPFFRPRPRRPIGRRDLRRHCRRDSHCDHSHDVDVRQFELIREMSAPHHCRGSVQGATGSSVLRRRPQAGQAADYRFTVPAGWTACASP
jgi:hypothetical protein